MNLFVVASRGEAPVRALADLAARLPFFEGRPVESHGPAAWVQHAPEDVGGVRYGDAVTVWSGRPFRWTGDTEADGALPPDFGANLDGRYAAVRWNGDLEVFTDALGAYPLYETERDGARYVSNNAELLRSIHGGRALDLQSVAGLLGGGWPLAGHPMWEGVRRINVPAPRPPEQREFDPDRAAERLVAATRALADWPGRPNIVPVTGGRDSRLVLGAALAAGIDFETRTGGEPGHPDVEIGRQLAEAAGVPWRTLEHDPHGSVAGDWRRAAELLDLTASGTASLSDAAGFPFGPRPGPLWLWHSGQGGEVARSYYGVGGGDLTDRLYRAFTGRRPGRTEVLGEDGRDIVRAQIGKFVKDALDAGHAPADVPDLFYLHRRMGTWAGPTHGAVEYVRDTTSPLWSRRVIDDMLSVPPAHRAREVFHLEVLKRLAPQLADIPFEDGRPWPARQSAAGLRAREAATFARKVRGELRRRMRAGRPAAGAPDPFTDRLAEIRDVVLSQPQHPAWQVLDRPRVDQLLGSDAVGLDTMSRYYAWRLATVFSAPLR